MLITLLIIALIEFVILLLVLAKLRNRKYDGSMIIYEGDEKLAITQELTTDPETWPKKKQLLFRVVNGDLSIEPDLAD